MNENKEILQDKDLAEPEEELALPEWAVNFMKQSMPLPEGTVMEGRMAPTRDGAALYSLVMKPNATGHFPTVLMRSPYSAPYKNKVTVKNYNILNPGLLVCDVSCFLNDGYAVIFQHCRGTGNSTGTFIMPALTECDDVCDTLEWLRKQEFYNGEIFRLGGSYVGMNTLIDAHKHHKDVKGIVAQVPLTRPAEMFTKNGFFTTAALGTWVPQTKSTSANTGPRNIDFSFDTFRTFPQKDWGKLIMGVDEPTFQLAQAHPYSEDPFWQSEEAPGHDLYHAVAELDVPILITSAWFDLFCKQLIEVWNEILPEKTREMSAFMLTPYSHNFGGPGNIVWPFEMEGGSMDKSFANHELNWFNHIRKGEPLKNIKTNAVTFFPECGQKNWYSEPKFTTGEFETTLFLNENRRLEAEPGNMSAVTYLYNPYSPAQYYGGTCITHQGPLRPGYEAYGDGNPLMPQDPPNWRYDVVSFEAEPFQERTVLKGEMSADLYVKSDCEDTCFYVRVHLVKDGVTYGIREDITSLCYQVGDYKPGEEVKLHFTFPPIAWDCQPGDQLRIDVTSSCFPLFSLHTNVKGNQSEVTNPKYAHNTVVFGKSSFTYHTTDLLSGRYEILEMSDPAEA